MDRQFTNQPTGRAGIKTEFRLSRVAGDWHRQSVGPE